MADRRVLVVVSPEIEAFGYDGVDSFASLQDAVPLNNQVRTINRIAPGVCTSNLCTFPRPRVSSPCVDWK